MVRTFIPIFCSFLFFWCSCEVTAVFCTWQVQAFPNASCCWLDFCNWNVHCMVCVPLLHCSPVIKEIDIFVHGLNFGFGMKPNKPVLALLDMMILRMMEHKLSEMSHVFHKNYGIWSKSCSPILFKGNVIWFQICI
jgi:hypothetical protein